MEFALFWYRYKALIANESGLLEDQKAWRGGRLQSHEKICVWEKNLRNAPKCTVM